MMMRGPGREHIVSEEVGEITYPYRIIEIAYITMNEAIERGYDLNSIMLAQQVFLIQILSIIRLNRPAFLEEFIAGTINPISGEISRQIKADFPEKPYLTNPVHVLSEVELYMDRKYQGYRKTTTTKMDRNRIDKDTLEIIADVLDNTFPLNHTGIFHKVLKKEVPFTEINLKETFTTKRLLEYYTGYDEKLIWEGV